MLSVDGEDRLGQTELRPAQEEGPGSSLLARLDTRRSRSRGSTATSQAWLLACRKQPRITAGGP